MRVCVRECDRRHTCQHTPSLWECVKERMREPHAPQNILSRVILPSSLRDKGRGRVSDSVHEKGCGRGREKDVVTVVLSSPLHRDKATGWGGGGGLGHDACAACTPHKECEEQCKDCERKRKWSRVTPTSTLCMAKGRRVTGDTVPPVMSAAS